MKKNQLLLLCMVLSIFMLMAMASSDVSNSTTSTGIITGRSQETESVIDETQNRSSGLFSITESDDESASDEEVDVSFESDSDTETTASDLTEETETTEVAEPTATPTPRPTSTPTPTPVPVVCEYVYVAQFRNTSYPNDSSLNYDLYYMFDTDNNRVYSFISTSSNYISVGSYTGTITSSGGWGIEVTIDGCWQYVSGSSNSIDISDEYGYCCYATRVDSASVESQINLPI